MQREIKKAAERHETLEESANADDREDLPPVLMIQDVARLLLCSTVTIRRRLHSHEFPVAPLPSIDKKLRWSSRAILDWINLEGVPPVSETEIDATDNGPYQPPKHRVQQQRRSTIDATRTRNRRDCPTDLRK